MLQRKWIELYEREHSVLALRSARGRRRSQEVGEHDLWFERILIPHRIIMGLDRNQKSVIHQSAKNQLNACRTPCGFAFVEYYLHSEAVASLRYISGTKLDERVIRCDVDPGYKEGRQFGRGKSGGQVRDEFRQEYDSGRGERRKPAKLTL